MLKSILPPALLMTLGLSAPGHAFDMGKISPILETGQSGVWDQRDEGRYYVLDNDQEENAIKFYHFFPRDNEVGKRRIHVDIEYRDPHETTHGGLIFGSSKETKTYYLFTLSPDGIITLLRRAPEGSKILFKGKGKNVKQERNTLSYVEKGDFVHLAVNGQSGLGSDTFDLGDRGVGIAAWGKGEFAFTRFRQFDAVLPHSDFSSLLRPNGQSRYSPKPECALPELGAPIETMSVEGRTPFRMDMPPQYFLVSLELMSEGDDTNGLMNRSTRQLPNLPNGGIKAEHICSGLESQKFNVPDAGRRAGLVSLRLLPSLDLAANYPKFGEALAKSDRTVRSKPRRFAAFRAFEDDEVTLRKALSDHPMVKAESSIWTLPGWILIPLR